MKLKYSVPLIFKEIFLHQFIFMRIFLLFHSFYSDIHKKNINQNYAEEHVITEIDLRQTTHFVTPFLESNARVSFSD